MLSYVKVVLILAVVVTSEQADNCNEKGLKRFDELISLGTSFGNINSKFPENEDQLKDWCK